MHRDIKPDNIFVILDEKPEKPIAIIKAKLIDFGLGTVQPSGYLLKDTPGTAFYAAPELLKYKPIYNGKHSDIFSYGATLYAALSQKIPYNWLATNGDQVLNASPAPPTQGNSRRRNPGRTHALP